MFCISIKIEELFNEATEEFMDPICEELVLEHSLVSISKWESIFKKPFLTKDEKSIEEIKEYIRCMTVNKVRNDLVYSFISDSDIKKITKYIDDPMSATTINNKGNGGVNREIPTSELIYYWMVACNIPFECQKWHISRLMNLINICSIKNAQGTKNEKPMSKSALAKRNHSLNQARRAKYKTRG